MKQNKNAVNPDLLDLQGKPNASGGERVSKDDIEEHEFNQKGKNTFTTETIDLSLLNTKVKVKPEYIRDNVILSVNHLKQFFPMGHGPNKSWLKAVHDVSFQIHTGECVGLVGESGCGKTTTGRTIMRLYPATSGSVYFKGVRIQAGSRWNEKEIKWKKIKAQKKIREIKADTSLSDDEKTAQIEKIQAETADIIRHQKAKIKQIKYDNRHVDKKLLSQIQMIFQDPIDSLDPKMTVEEIIKEGMDIKLSREYPQARKNAHDQMALAKKDFEQKTESLSREALTEAEKQTRMQEIQAAYHNRIAEIKADLASRKPGGKTNHAAVSKALKEVGLIESFASRYPHEFSGGQRQRIGIARALVMNPELLICDEPISALDVSIRAQIINLLNNLKETRNLSILFIAHDLSVVKYFCDRIAVMYFGDMVEFASSDELFRHPLHPYTKSLLSAIPKPNPLSERRRDRIHYDPRTTHDYSKEKPTFQEILPGHWILANSDEMVKYREEIKKYDEGLRNRPTASDDEAEEETVADAEQEIS